jgi:acetylornithine/succinyldiaminopimelate/putrescine aminotransferase
MASAEKQEFIEKSKTYWNPNKTQFWQDQGVDLVIDRREGYLLYDMDGRRLIDVHLNGGTYNIGHRHPELIEVLHRGTTRFDMGNHHFPALGRTALAEELAKVCGGGMQYTMYTAGGAEAIDLAIKTARNATKKRKIVSIINAYHGHSGLAVATGADRFSKPFLSDQRSQCHGRRVARQGHRRRHHGDDPGNLRFSDAIAGLSSRSEEAL